MIETFIPTNYASETAALSCLANDIELVDQFAWPEDLFFSPANKIILESIIRCRKAGAQSSDFFAILGDITSRGMLEAIGGDLPLINVFTALPGAGRTNLEFHRGQLMDAMRYRQAWRLTNEAADTFRRGEGDISALADKLAEISTLTERSRKSLKEQIADLVNDMESTATIDAIPTGIPRLDELTSGGVGRGQLAVVAAETSGGKSILLLQLALNAALAGKRVLIFSLEMPPKSVLKRFMASLCGMPVRKRSEADPLTKGEIKAYQLATAQIAKMDLTIDSEVTDWASIESTARELNGKKPLDLIVVDYIQLVRLRELGRNETREQHVSEIAARLKSLALQLNVPVASASQLNDEGKLRESRAIGHHADHIWNIIKLDEDRGIYVAKNREGQRDVTIPVQMRGDISRFESL